MIKDDLARALSTVLAELDIEIDATAIELEQPARREFGDWSSNVAMVTAKKAGTNPRQLATDVVDRLTANPPRHVDSIEIAGPGFINFRLAPTWLHDVLTATVSAGESFGDQSLGEGEHVNVEFMSVNPNGPLHGGHARGVIYGDAVARLLEKCNYRVTRESYTNDRGVQMQNFAKSLIAAKNGDPVPEDGYGGAYISEWAAEMPADADAYEWGYARAMENQKATLARLGIAHDVYFSERSMVDDGTIENALEKLKATGHVYEQDGAQWLRTTDFGDQKDRVLVKSDGDYTYFTPDIAYHVDKFSRAAKLIDIFGADHHGYIERMQAAMGALGHDPGDLEIIIIQMIKLQRDGIELRMQKRTGDFIALDDMIDEVGADAVRFTYLMQSMDTVQTLDLADMAARSMDNPVFYVQMAHARICSLVDKATETGITRASIDEVDLGVLTNDRELEVLRVLAGFDDVVSLACRDRAPHKVIAWLRELAAAFHGFYHDCYVVGDGVSPDQTQARLWLCEAARIGLVAGLDLIGVSAPREM